MELSFRLIDRDPEAAYTRLQALFAKHDGNMEAVAKQLGYDRTSIKRWIALLVASGHGDPRGAQRGRPGRKPAKTSSSK